MAHKKRRVMQHIMEDQSMNIIRRVFPQEWVLHQYSPDYGIDVVVEIFEYVDKNKRIAETLGELFFAQVKSINHTHIKQIRVRGRKNVEKYNLESESDGSLDIDVIKFKIDTDELLTVQSMGSGIPVLLLLVCLDTEKIYFLCLNDIIDKVVLPNDPNYTDKKTLTLNVPVKNTVDETDDSLVPLRFYAKRNKFYSAFSKFVYQRNEISHFHRLNNYEMILHFIKIIKRFDFWETTPMWGIIQLYYQRIINLEKAILSINHKASPVKSSFSIEEELVRHEILNVWDGLVTLSNNYEELCREWYLPTYLAQYLSYKELPEEPMV